MFWDLLDQVGWVLLQRNRTAWSHILRRDLISIPNQLYHLETKRVEEDSLYLKEQGQNSPKAVSQLSLIPHCQQNWQWVSHSRNTNVPSSISLEHSMKYNGKTKWNYITAVISTKSSITTKTGHWDLWWQSTAISCLHTVIWTNSRTKDWQWEGLPALPGAIHQRAATTVSQKLSIYGWWKWICHSEGFASWAFWKWSHNNPAYRNKIFLGHPLSQKMQRLCKHTVCFYVM